MKYLVVRTKFLTDGTVKAIGTENYDSVTKAEAKAYTAIGNDLKDETLNGSITLIVDENGGIFFNKAWNRSQYPLEVATE